MSNHVSILFLDGPKHGVVHRCPRPVPGMLEVTANVNSMAFYYPRIAVIAGINYRVALPADSDFSDDTIHMHIIAFAHPAAWDLNPPYTTNPQAPSP